MRNKFYARAWRILRPIVLFFLPVELRGTENLEDEAAILCANHSSAWDPILLVLSMPQSFSLRIMAKNSCFPSHWCAGSCGTWVFFRWIAATAISAR